MLLCWAQVTMKSKKYWSRAIDLSLPLLLLRNREKKVITLDVLITMLLVNSPVNEAARCLSENRF